MRIAKIISVVGITCSILIGPAALGGLFSSKFTIPADVLSKFTTNASFSKPVERVEISPATTNIVVVPNGTNLIVAYTGTNLMIASPLTNTAASAATNSMTIPRGTNSVIASSDAKIPAGTNSIVLANTNAVPLQPGTNLVVVPQTTNVVSNAAAAAEPNGREQLIAYIQIQSEKETESEFGEGFKNAFYVGEVTVENTNGSPVLVYSSSLQVGVKYFIHPSELKRITKAQRDLIPTGAFLKGKRRPATFSDILAIFDYQQKKNWKQRTVDVIKSLGQVAAGASVFVGDATYPKAVAFVTGIINPEIEKHLLWDLLLHAKNLESRSFKEIEEIPPYKPITKLVFFPKGGIPGILDDKIPVYLGAFPYDEPDVNVEVQGALLKEQQGITSKPIPTQ